MALGSLVVSLLAAKPYFQFRWTPHIAKYGQYWQALTYHVVYTNSSEMLLGSLILYHAARMVERAFGTKKMGVRSETDAALSPHYLPTALAPLARVGHRRGRCSRTAPDKAPNAPVDRETGRWVPPRGSVWRLGRPCLSVLPDDATAVDDAHQRTGNHRPCACGRSHALGTFSD